MNSLFLSLSLSCTAKEEGGTDFEEIRMEELDCYLGIVIASGLTHQTRTSFDTLWQDSLFIPIIFRTVMNRNRARDIRRFMRFDDKSTRTDRLATDKLAAIREIYEIIVKQFKSSYQPNANLTVDERISPFRGRVGFRIYMKSKPKKYGIKEWVLCDSVNSYTLNFKIYSGKEGNKREKNQGENVVMDLTSHLEAGYNITTDNFFTSVPLALKLQMRRNPMTLLGTIKANRLHIPPGIKNHPKTEEYSSKFLFSNDMMLVNYIPKLKKSVILLSSDLPIDELMDGEKRKPKIIDNYNHTKYGVDKLDGMTQSISYIRATRRWTVNLFSNMLDMICLNSFVCYREAVDQTIERKDFMMKMCLELCKSNAKNRLSIPNLASTVKENIFKLYPDLRPEDVTTEPRMKPAKNDKCEVCVGLSKDKKFATQFCSSCNKKVCTKHQKPPKCIGCN